MSEEISQLVDMVAKLRVSMDEGFARMDKKFAEIDERFEEMDNRFEEMDKRFEEMDKRFDKLDSKNEEHDDKFNELFKLDNTVRKVLAEHMRDISIIKDKTGLV